MKPFLSHQLNTQNLITLAIGLMAGIFILVLTLNLMAAFLVFVMSILALVFRQSYSRGWLLLLAMLLLFPSIRLNEQGVLLSDLILVALALIGLINLTLSRFNLPAKNLFYEFFLLTLCGFSILSFGYLLNHQVNYTIWRITIILILIWIVLVTFQYYFQTLKRIKRFFITLFIVGLLHSIFGLVMFWGNWQTSSGMGISSTKQYHSIFGDINHQLNGFLGMGLIDRLKTNALAPLLMISLTTNVGFLVLERKKRKNNLLEEEEQWQSDQVTIFSSLNPVSDSMTVVDASDRTLAPRTSRILIWKEKLWQTISGKEMLLLLAFVLQLVALTLTLSESAIIFLAIGLLVFGILDRNKQLMAICAGVIAFFALILPSLSSSITIESSRNLSGWFEGLDTIGKSWLLGIGWRSGDELVLAASQKIHNTYLYIWNNLGIIGLGITVTMLGKYFVDLYQGYRTSDGAKRVWLMVIVAIFIELALEAMTGNILLYGPAAVIFWLLYGAAINLRRKPVLQGLTESTLLRD